MRGKLRGIVSSAEAMGYLAPSLFLFTVFVFVPLARTVRLSLYTTDPIGRLASFVGLGQFNRILADPKFLHSIGLTLLFALYTVPTMLAASMVLALLGTVRLRRIALFRMLFSSPIAVSAATASLIFVSLYHPALGSLNYLLGVVHVMPVSWLVNESTALASIALTTVWLQVGLNTIVLLAGLQDVPHTLYESACIDGAGPGRVFLGITLPLLTPTLFFLLVVDVLSAFQTFTQFHVMTRGGPNDSTNVVVFSIYREFYFNGRYGIAAAQALVLFLIMLVLTLMEFKLLERRVHYA
jgi:sn-glycerol 3-phosphate transport system permease protein